MRYLLPSPYLFCREKEENIKIRKDEEKNNKRNKLGRRILEEKKNENEKKKGIFDCPTTF